MHAPLLGSLPLDLQGRIDAILAKARAPISLACFDRLTRETWALEGDRPFPAGQLSALPLLLHAYDAAQRDELDLESLRPLLIRCVTECDGEAVTALAERLFLPEAESVTARALLDSLAALDDAHPLWDLLVWEGDRTKFPRRLPRVPMAYKAADRCEPPLAHAAGRLGGPGGVVLVVLTEGDAAANSLIGRLAKAVWDHHLDRLDEQQDASERLAQLHDRRLPDARLGLMDLRPTWHAGRLRLSGETTLPEALWPQEWPQGDVAFLRGEPAMVGTPVLNLRREPRHGSELVSQAPLGTPLTVLKRPEGEWWRVQTPDGYVAWGRSDNIRLGAPATDDLRILPVVYAAPRRDGAGTIPLAAGSSLRVLERQDGGDWAETPAGEVVWVEKEAAIAMADLPSLWRTPEALGARAVAVAQAWLGIPYLWGGKSGWGFDCSGLTQLAYELLGVRLPRDADLQAQALPAVAAWQDLLPGDLLFYPGHVTMWAGDGTVIHASSPRGQVVREDVTQVPWLRERCTGLRRPVMRL